MYVCMYICRRFNLIKEHGVQEVDLWQMPIPDTWFPALRDFVNEDHEDNSSLIGVLSAWFPSRLLLESILVVLLNQSNMLIMCRWV